MNEVGLLQPIIIAEDGVLIAGWHRVEAAKQLGWKTIPGVIAKDGSADLKRLMELDENLVRADLSPAERAAHQAEWKAIYERQHPEGRRGGDRGNQYTGGKPASRQNGDVVQRHTKKAREAQGVSERTVQREVERAANIPQLAQLVGTSLDTASELDALAKLPNDRQTPLIARAKNGEKVSAKAEAKKLRREEREAALLRKQMALPDLKFGVIVEDFEWDQQVWSRTTGMDRHAANHYPVSERAHTAEEIHEYTKDRFACAADDCVLFMWATAPYLAVAIDVLRLRGFRYVSNYVWGKDRLGTGYWNRNKHEHLLIGVKGNIPCPAPGTQWNSLIMAPVGRHSTKPECFLEMIEGYFPNLAKIELNPRGPARPCWDCWGNEVAE
jgi:N6-adenosine-specific RNA methylase IME4